VKILAVLKSLGYKVYTRPFELNIIGVRSKTVVPLKFDDKIHLIYKNENGKWIHKRYNTTTDPSSYWLKSPLNFKGTALLKQGQYINAYSIGYHKGQYKALVQTGRVTVIRDSNRDSTLDFFSGIEETGLFGINIHRALSVGQTKYIDRFSAGCQVFEDATHFQDFLFLAEKHRALYGNRFTYSLIDFRQKRKQTIKGLFLFGLTSLTTALGVSLFRYDKKQH
jgi:hypothetical protein